MNLASCDHDMAYAGFMCAGLEVLLVGLGHDTCTDQVCRSGLLAL